MPQENGAIADGAVEGGTLEGEITFVCRAVCDSYVYDPRLGFRQTEPWDFQSKYVCYSQLGSKYLMYPISREQKISGNLYYGSKTGGKRAIHCDPEEGFESLELEIRLGKCGSLAECDLKFSPMPLL
ncbi:unnamed protein product, partial [Allacma fusca]